MKDLRGTELRVGQVVCYNFSGQIARGVITALTEGEYEDTGFGWQRRLKKPMIVVRRTHPTNFQRNGNPVSKVRDATSVMVIFEEEDALS